MKARNWTLRKRITVGFGLLCIALVAVGTLSIIRLRPAVKAAERMDTIFTAEGQLANRVLDASSELAIASRGFDVVPSEENWAKVQQWMDKSKKTVADLASFSGAHPELTELAEDVVQVQGMFARYSATVLKYREAQQNLDGAWSKMVPAGGALFKALSEVAAYAGSTDKDSELKESLLTERTTAEAFRDAAEMRLACWRAKAGDDASAAIAAEEKSADLAKRLTAFASSAPAEIKSRLERSVAALKVYETGTHVLQEAIEGKLKARAERSDTYFAFIAKVKEAQAGSTAAIQQAATSQAQMLEITNRQITIVSLASVILGVAVAVLITRKTGRLLGDIANTLSSNAAETTASSGVIASASQTLAEGSSEQAASLEETSSSLEELASMTKRNADDATQANSLSRETRDAAERGATEMKEMVTSIEQIKAGSDDIARIIKTIEEIAFQTNILALNAAVEAARAGEAGLGFAVVADEVRALAHRCAAAAKDIAEKIEKASEQTAHGVTICSKVETSLSEIVSKIRRVDELVAQVTTASGEQRDGIEQINTAIVQMDRVTQSTAASAEETASAANDLSSQAERLKSAVDSLVMLVHGSTDAAAIHAAPSGAPAAQVEQTTHADSDSEPAPAPVTVDVRTNGQANGANGRRVSPATASNGRAPRGKA